MRPLVSIIVPVYNVQDYISKCLDSLVGQSYQNIEIIVVDDGSTDHSGAICDKYAKKDGRIKVFHKKNGGLSSARNHGIKKSKGDFICLVDSDDYVKKNFVEKMIDGVTELNVDIVICGYNDEIPKKENLTGKEATLRLLTLQNNMEIIAWNKMYRRVLFDNIKYPAGLNHEDNLTTYKLLSVANQVTYVPKSLYRYIERTGSIMNKEKKEEKLKFRERAAKEAVQFFKNDSDLKRAAEIALLTSKIAYIDFAISGDIDKKYLNENIMWVRKNKKRLLNNEYLNKKLKLYIRLITNFNAKLYIGFRKIRHE